LPRKQWLKIAAEYFQSDHYQDDPDYCRVIVWRNRTAASLNSWIREQLWGANAPLFVVGDRLIARKPVFRASADKDQDHQIIMNNSEECEVIDQAQKQIDQFSGWEFWEVPVIADSEVKISLRILSSQSETKRQATIRELREKKQWKRAIAQTGQPQQQFVNAFAKAEAAPSGAILDRRHTMLDDSDISATRMARAVVGAVVASVTQDPTIYISGGSEHQGPPGGAPVAVISRL
jgi:hypothetical protein